MNPPPLSGRFCTRPCPIVFRVDYRTEINFFFPKLNSVHSNACDPSPWLLIAKPVLLPQLPDNRNPESIGTLSKIQNHTRIGTELPGYFFFFFWHRFRLVFEFVHGANIIRVHTLGYCCPDSIKKPYRTCGLSFREVVLLSTCSSYYATVSVYRRHWWLQSQSAFKRS